MTDFRDILYFYPEKKKKKSSLQETFALMTKITNSFLSAKSMHANTISIRKTKISGDRTHPRSFTFFSLVFFWHNFAVKHAFSAISHMICS